MESATSGEGEGEIDFGTYVAIEAALSEGGGPVALLLAEEGIGREQDYAAARTTFEGVRAKSPSAEEGFQRMKAYFVEEYRAAQKRREAERLAQEAEKREAERARAAAAERVLQLDAEPPPAAEAPKNKLQGTALALDVPRGPALPFAPAPPVEKSAAPEAAPPAAPSPPAEPRPALSGTALAVEIPKVLPLPFVRKNAPPEAPPPPVIKRAPEKLAGTLPLGQGPLPLPATPFRATATPATPVSAPPRLTLEQHASLCAELAFYSGREEAVLLRYGVDAAGKSTLDDHYRGAVQKSPEARLAWNRTFQTYSSWLAKQR